VDWLPGLAEKRPAQWFSDIEIVFVGFFRCEKLHEELLANGMACTSQHPRIMRIEKNAFVTRMFDTPLTGVTTACDHHDRAMMASLVNVIHSKCKHAVHLLPPAAALALQGLAFRQICRFMPVRI
jgi:FlaA1/EpsC-like NDP-sugar epimerase